MRWVLTVASERNSRPAISPLDSPRATWRSTSSSREVSSDSGAPAFRAGAVLAQRHRQAAGPCLLDQPGDVGQARLRRQPRRLVVVGIQRRQQAAHLPQRAARGLLDRLQRVPGARLVAAHQLLGRSGLHGDQRDAVGHDVVQLASHAGALLDHGGSGAQVVFGGELDRERLRAAVFLAADTHDVSRCGRAADDHQQRDVVLGRGVVPGRCELLPEGHDRSDPQGAQQSGTAAAGLAPGRAGADDDLGQALRRRVRRPREAVSAAAPAFSVPVATAGWAVARRWFR